MEAERESITAQGRNWLTVSVVNIAHAFAHLNNQAISVLWPVLREEFGFGYTGIAGLVIASEVAGSIDVMYGFVVRFMRRLHVLAIGTLVAFTGVFGIAFSQSYVHLMASKVVRNLGTSPNHPVGGAIMADAFPRARTKAFALYQTFGSIGGWIAPLLVGGMLYFLNWRVVVIILALPLLLAALMFFAVREPAPRAEPGESGRRRARLALGEFKTVIRDRNVIVLGLAMAVGACGRGVGGLNTYLTPFMVDRFGVTVPFAAMFLTVYTLSGIVGPLVMSWIADRTSPQLILRLSLALSAGFNLLFLVPQTPGISLAAIIFLAGFFTSARAILTQSMLVNLGPKDVRIDTLLGVYGTMGAVVGPFWTLLTGVIVDKFGISPAFQVMAVSYLLGIVIIGYIRPIPNQEPTQPNM